ncbi:MAG: hypothetical protein ACON4U_18835 [Myxococcota bacterium]
MLLNILLSITPEATAVRYADVYDMSELAAASSKIVDGTVERIETRMVNGKIISRLHLEVTKTWVGARNTELYVDVLGGTLDGITMTVPGGPTFEEGESVLLFIDQHRIVGFGQGAYTIDGDEATRVASEGLPADYDVIEPSEILPDEEKARSCLETSVWSDYDDDWALRMMDTAHLSPEEYKAYPVTILAGTEYHFQACNDGKAKDVRLELVDIEGQPLLRDDTREQQAELFYKGEYSETVYLIVSASEYEERAAQTGISMSILYR